MKQRKSALFSGLLIAFLALFGACHSSQIKPRASLNDYTLNFDTPVDRDLQREIESIDAQVRNEVGMAPEHAALGVLDLRRLRLAMIHPDRGEYAASVPKVGILLAYFHLRSDAAANLPNNIREELGSMVKTSSNEAAAKFSQTLGLPEIQRVLNEYGFYNAKHGSGIWVGKHYGVSGERYGDPVGDNSHAATVRQLLRFYLMLEQGKLVSPAASKTMREIFESPEIPHDNIKFVKALANENVQIIRKWGSWEDWLHDSAVVRDSQRHYIIVGLTHHPRGDEYLEKVGQAVHRLM